MEEVEAVALDSGVRAPEAPAMRAEDSKVEAAMAVRAEIDTSAPFVSVREAVDRFGGLAIWKSQLKQLFHPEKHRASEGNEVIEVEEQAEQLEKDLILKEKETLKVLEELDMAKKIVDGLKLKLQKESYELNKMPAINLDNIQVNPIHETEEHCSGDLEKNVPLDDITVEADQSTALVAMELNQAKENLSRTTCDLARIQTDIKRLNMKIEEEKLLLVKSQEKLTTHTALIVSLEDDLNQTTARLQMTKDLESEKCEDSSNIIQEIKEMNSVTEQSKKTAEAAKVEVSKLTSEIEQTKANIKTAEIRWLAAKKMEEAAKAAEAMALADIKALMCSNNSILDLDSTCGVTLSVEEYITLASKAQEADQISKKKIEAAMAQVDEANISVTELHAKVEEATTEAKKCKKALEDALRRAEVANRAKLEVEDALRRWRSEHGQKRQSVHNPTKFKNYAAHHRKDSRLSDLKDLDTSMPFSGQLSIGQILSIKLMGPGSPGEYEGEVCEKENEKPTVSLGQILNKRQGVYLTPRRTDDNKHYSSKRKKLGFVGLPLLLAKQNKKNKKKRQSLSSAR